jgi:hypothetical protein
MNSLLAKCGRLVVIFAILTPMLQAQWQNLGGPWYVMGFFGFSFAALRDSLGNSTIFAASEGGPYVYLSTDNGSHWQPTNNGLTTSAISSLCAMNGVIFAGTPNGIFVSTDRGAQWIQRNNGMAQSTPAIYPTAVLGPYIFAAQTYKIYRSSDMGLNWTEIGHNGVWGGIRRLVSTDSSLAVGTDSWLFISSDYGQTWTREPFGGNCWGLASRSRSIFAASYDEPGGLFRSTDNGVTWDQPQGGYNLKISTLCASPSHLFAGTNTGIFVSQDDGASWTSFSEIGDDLVDASSLFVWDEFLFAGCHGFWRRPLSDAPSSVDRPEDHVLSSYTLGQNFPNPFNPTTTIRFQLPIRVHVRLVVYDLFGRVVSTVVDDVKDAGSYDVSLDAQSLCSGTYFYRLQSSVGSVTRKMMLVR